MNARFSRPGDGMAWESAAAGAIEAALHQNRQPVLRQTLGGMTAGATYNAKVRSQVVQWDCNKKVCR